MDNKKNKHEFMYIDELSDLEKIKLLTKCSGESNDSEQVTYSKLLYCDPGKRDLLTIIDDDGVMFQYSNKRWNNETNKFKYANKLNTFLGKPLKYYKKRKKKVKIKNKNYKIQGKKNKIQGKKNPIHYKKEIIKKIPISERNQNKKLQKSYRKQLKHNNSKIDNNDVILHPNTDKEFSIIEMLNKHLSIQLHERTIINNNAKMFNNIYNDFIKINNIDINAKIVNNIHNDSIKINNITEIDAHIFKNLLLFAKTKQEQNIYNTYANDKKSFYTQLANFRTQLKKDENKVNKKNIICDNLILQLHDKTQKFYESEQLSLKEQTCINSKRTYSIDDDTTIFKINKSINLITNEINNIKSKYKLIYEQLIKLDKNYNYTYVLNERLNKIYKEKDEHLLININNLKCLNNFSEMISKYTSIIKYNNKICNSEKKRIKDYYDCMTNDIIAEYELSNNTIFKMIDNILYDIRINMYTNNNKIKENNVNNYIKNEYMNECFNIKYPDMLKQHDDNKITNFKKTIDSYFRLIKSYTSPFFNNDYPNPIDKKKISLSIEENMTYLRTKTCNIERFKQYVAYKNYAIKNEYGDVYKDPIFLKYKWYAYIDKQRALDNLLNTISSIYGSNCDITIIYGDWSIGHQLRNFKPTPMISLKRKLKTRFKIYNIDEFRTSMLDYKTESICDNLHIADKCNSLRKIHSVLTYKMNGRLSCINRDYNAVMNMRKITQCCLNNKPRPNRYCRGIIINDTLNAANLQPQCTLNSRISERSN